MTISRDRSTPIARVDVRVVPGNAEENTGSRPLAVASHSAGQGAKCANQTLGATQRVLVENL